MLLPSVGFGDLLDDGVALAEQVGHVAAQDDAFGDPAQRAEWRGEAEVVAHFGETVGQGAKVVVVLHGVEGAAQHGVLEVGGRLESGDGAGQVLADAEMAGAPCDLLAGTDEAGAGSRGGLLAGVGVAEQVDLDGTSEIEAAFEGCGDQRGFVELDHAVDFPELSVWDKCGTGAGFGIRHTG